MLGSCAFFSKTWIDVSGSSAKDVSILNMNCHIYVLRVVGLLGNSASFETFKEKDLLGKLNITPVMILF